MKVNLYSWVSFYFSARILPFPVSIVLGMAFTEIAASFDAGEKSIGDQIGADITAVAYAINHYLTVGSNGFACVEIYEFRRTDATFFNMT